MLNKVKLYDEFILEGMVNESIIYYGDNFYNILLKISNMDNNQWTTTAKNKTTNADIGRVEVQELVDDLIDRAYKDNSANILLIDINDNNTISYTRANTIKSEEDKETLREIEDNPSSDKIDDLSDLIYGKPRESIKIGRFIKLLGMKYPQIVIDEFIKLVYNYNQPYNDTNLLNIEVVAGEDIPYWYSREHCISTDYVDNVDKLHKTCMLDVSSTFFDIYKNNPESVKLIVVTLNEKLIARALLWNTDKGSFVDTIYSANQGGIDKISEMIRNNNYSTDKNIDMKVSLDFVPNIDNSIAFLDTFIYLNRDKKLLSNVNLNDVKLNDLSIYGIIKGNKRDYIKHSEAVYSDIIGTYIHRDIVIESEDGGVYSIYSDEVSKLNSDIYGNDEYVMTEETTTDYLDRIIDIEDVVIVLSDTDEPKESKASIIDIRKSKSFIEVDEVSNMSWFTEYVSYFGNFEYILSDLVTNINDKFILNKYSNVKFISTNGEIITTDIADILNIRYSDTLIGYDIFDIFSNLKRNGNILELTPSELLSKLNKDSDTYNMLRDVSSIKKTDKYQERGD